MPQKGEKIWILKIDTEACDHYLLAFANKPSNKEVFDFLKENFSSDFIDEDDKIPEYFEDPSMNWNSLCHVRLIESELH